MEEYKPEYCKAITIQYYVVEPGQKQTIHQPGFLPEIEIQAIIINGKDSGLFLFEKLMKHHEQEWIDEIRGLHSIAA